MCPEKIKSIIAEQLGVKPEEVTPQASFVDDLGADSLDTVELVMALEEEFGIEIPDEDAEKMTTVGEAIKYIEDNINVPYDTINGNVQVLIMVEDSIRFYSMFLPIIYTEIVQQTRRSLSEDLNEMQRLLRRRTRP